MNKWKLLSGHIGGGVAWFRVKGYGLAAIKCPTFSKRNGYHKRCIKMFGWRVEALSA